MITVRVITGLPGSGKTFAAIKEIASQKGRYLFVTSRIELINERSADLRRATVAAGTNPTIHLIHSPPDGGYRAIPVQAELIDAPNLHRNEDHVVLMITHEAMMSADFDGFAGWHIYIDENPAALSSGVIRASATAIFLRQVYDLTPVAGMKDSRVVVKADVLGTASLVNDDFLNRLAEFDKRVRSKQGVYVDVDDWGVLEGSSRLLKWWSAWTPAVLDVFASVTIIAAGYFDSLGYKATLKLFPDEVTFKEHRVDSPRRALCHVPIYYFTNHKGSTSFWAGKDGEEGTIGSDGKRCMLVAIGHLKTVHDLGYWGANKAIEPYCEGACLPGQQVSPRQEGTNSLMHHTSCAILYSSKALPSDGPLLEAFGFTKAEIQRARETEDIHQFVMRGVLRCPDFDGTYPIYLYSRDQAVALADYLTREGIARVELAPLHEAGIMDIERPPSGPKKPALDEQSKAEAKAKRKENEAERQKRRRQSERDQRQREGKARRPGRPKKEVLSFV